jgi:hypothetical protein
MWNRSCSKSLDDETTKNDARRGVQGVLDRIGAAVEHRRLGLTGVSVSKFCLGAMMFGAWGNPDHDESIGIIHTALDAGINFVKAIPASVVLA